MDIWGNCKNCMWYGTEQCDKDTEETNGECSYSPILEEVSDDEAMLLVEEGRKEYYEAYYRYIRGDVLFEDINTFIQTNNI